MIPVLFKIGTFEVHTYGVMLIIAFFVALWLARKRAPRFGFTPDEVSDVALWTLLVGILGARVMFILLELPDYLKNPGSLLSLRFQGLTSFGGLLFGFLFLLFWTKRKGKSSVAMFDLASGPVMVAFAIGRIGCLLNGCCYGAPCDPGAAFCVAVEKQPGLYFPAQLIDSAMNLIGYGILVAFERRGLFVGQSLALFFVLHGASRFFYEFFRAGVSSEVLGFVPLTLAHLTAAAFILVGAVLFAWYGRRARMETPPA